MFNNDEILNGARTAFIHENSASSLDFRPKLLYNNDSSKVINSIRDELRNCDEFIISSAFITESGITPLLEEFRYLQDNNIKGKILTTDYLYFTEPKALKKLQSFNNIEIKIYPHKQEGFHTKGYVFKKNNIYKGIVGSSNLTMNALTVNKEWNVEFTSLVEGEILNSILEEFNDLWDSADSLTKALPQYEILYKAYKRTRLQKPKELLSKKEDLIPNIMQEEFIDNIRDLVKRGENKALLVSATGTGKTYASAFAVHDFKPKKFLFLVHREQIAKQSINAYKNIFKDDENFGLMSGSSKDFNSNYLFSTIQTMSKEEIYNEFGEDEFDFIVIDEVHKAGALSYQKIFNYFKPKFWLGMTASPERTDGFNIYEMFDNNIAHEIRLQEALEEDLLCPFHYFGIADIELENTTVTDNFKDYDFLSSNKRVSYLLEKSEYYGYSGDKIKALVFCSTKKEAKLLSHEFTKRGHPSEALTGDDSQQTRQDAITRLTSGKLEYIFTVDIFNEGVDIPEINQVLLVRPTESPIIFIQQLGRGLRKYKDKEYVVIIDFIGNYKNNFMIPIALSGDRTYNKDKYRKYVREVNKIIPGSSTINFDEISRKRIYESLNNTLFSRIALFKENYNNLKFKLGKIPMLCDFYENGEMDPLLILNHSSFDCYSQFIEKVEKDYTNPFSEGEINALKIISKNLANGMRPHEIFILKCLVHNSYFDVNTIENLLQKEYGLKNQRKSVESAINLLSLDFFTQKEKEKYGLVTFFNKNNEITDEFRKFLSHETFRIHLNDLLDYALLKYENTFLDKNSLKLYEKYSRKDVCRLLNWPHDDSSTIYGYRIKHGTCPIFVTYEKTDDISESTKYEDKFLNKEVFSWMTRSKVKLESKEAHTIINDNDLDIYLFIKKSDDEGRDFYYIGPVKPFEWRQTTIKNDKGKDLPIVNFKFKLMEPVKDELYDYLVN